MSTTRQANSVSTLSLRAPLPGLPHTTSEREPTHPAPQAEPVVCRLGPQGSHGKVGHSRYNSHVHRVKSWASLYFEFSHLFYARTEKPKQIN